MTSILQVSSFFKKLTKRAGIAGEDLKKPILISYMPSEDATEMVFYSGPIRTSVPLRGRVGNQMVPREPMEYIQEGIDSLLTLMQIDHSTVNVGEWGMEGGVPTLVAYPQGYNMDAWAAQMRDNKQNQVTEEEKKQKELEERKRRIVPPAPPEVEEEPKPKKKRTRKKKKKEEVVEGPGALTLGPGGAVPQSPIGYVEKNLGGRLQEPVPDFSEEIPEPPVIEKAPPKPPEAESIKNFDSIDDYVGVYEKAIDKGAIAPGSIVHGDKLISAAIEYATARAMSGGEEWEGPMVVTLYIDGKFYYYHWTESAPPESIFRKDQEGKPRLPDEFYNYEYMKKPYTIRFPHRSAAQKKMGDSPDRWVNANRDSIRQKKRADIPIVEKGEGDNADLFRLLYKGGVELWYALTNDGFYKRVSSETLVVSREQLNMFSNMVGTDMFEGDNQITPGIKTSSFMRKLIKTSNRFSIRKLLDED